MNYERGNMVQYTGQYTGLPAMLKKDRCRSFPVGLVVDVEYLTKPDDFLVYIMWPNAEKPQALFQRACIERGLRILN